MLIPPNVKRLLLSGPSLALGLLVIALLTACAGRPSASLDVRTVSAQAAGDTSDLPIQPLVSDPQNSQPADAVAPSGGLSTPTTTIMKKSISKDPAPAYSVQSPPPAQSSSASPETAAPAVPVSAAAPSTSEQAPQADLEVKPEVGFQAPDFALQTLGGETIRLSDLRGRPVVISYWASWCEPCKEELPVLNSLSQEYASSGIQVITVDAIEQDTLDKVHAIVSQLGLNLTVLLDQKDQFHSSYQQLFFPTSYFVDSHGVIRYVKLGSATADELRAQVNQLINAQFE